MKKAVLLHGTDGSTDDHWFPRLRRELERAGYDIFCPDLPGKHTPNQHVYEAFLKDSGWDFADNIVVGHSSGAATALNLLTADWFPRVKVVVTVGTFLNEKLTKSVEWYEEGQFDNLFLETYDPEVIRPKAEKFIFVHSRDDPYCDFDDAKALCNELGGEFIEIQNGGHLGGGSGLTELPEVMDRLKEFL